MNFEEVIKNRFSVRKFKDQKIDKESLERIIRAGILAPTACNRQPIKLIVVESDEGLELLRKCTPCHFNCPNAIIVLYDKDQCWKRDFDGKTSGDIDASIVCTHMMLEASSLNIGSTWIMYFIPEAIMTEFSLPDNLEPVSILILGYPENDIEPSKLHYQRKDIEELIIRK